MTKYDNPPLVEAWIAFDFEPKADKVAWEKEQINAFAKSQANDFARIEMIVREEVRIERSNNKELPRITDRQEIIDVVRMHNQAGTRIKQLGEDRIAYNLLRTAQEKYPSFGQLLDEALVYLNQYRAFFQPQGIRLATIHYVDVIEIPLGDKPTILTDYFGFIPDIPEEQFGLTVGYALRFVTKCPLDGAPLSTQLAIIPSPDPQILRVRLDWEKPCLGLNFQDEDQMKTGLKQSKVFVVNCFERFITDKTRSLFKPTSPPPMPIDLHSTQIVAVADWNLFNHEARLYQVSVFESSRYELSEIVYGFAKYPLKRLLRATYLRSREEFLVEGLSPEVVGRGVTSEEACDDFCLKFHSLFQDLVYKRPFEMSADDSLLWNRIKDIVDVTVYRNRTPLVVEQYGVVSYGQLSRPCKIKWDNGHTESVDVRKVNNADFVRYLAGQPIKAIVRRNPVTRELIDIPFIQKIATLPCEADLVTGGFVDQVLGAEPFPDADWD